MTFGQEIEYMRKLRGYTIIDMCNILCVTESKYKHIIAHGGPLNIYQKISLVIAMEYPFDSMPKN
ncbi:MAG: hypothetical protein IJ500_01340 [Alphaproteobacteria bacterium]|nr:hypothetical protein [Alphaproteobacteria bacterium]